jgi:hypothetical protein
LAKANDTNEANDKPLIRQGCRFDEANDATADKADVADKPAEAEEANAEADVADEAIMADEIEANVIGKIIAADETIVIDNVVALQLMRSTKPITQRAKEAAETDEATRLMPMTPPKPPRPTTTRLPSPIK